MKDIQSQTDKRNIPINKVGVRDIEYPIILDDPEQGKQNSIAKVDMCVDLPHHYRGTHMSRFVEILHHYHKENIVDSLEDLLQEMKEKLNAETAYIQLNFPYFIQKKAPKTGYKSLLSYQCKFNAMLDDNFKLILSVKVPVVLLCPCSKEISKKNAHNQRAYVEVEVRYKELVWIEELVAMVEKSASQEIYTLLKRPDEKYITESSYENPKFVEDVVREVAQKLKKHENIVDFRIQANSNESIHNHIAYAMVRSENFERNL
ncbi:MAG: GTP cyclohydrolase I FolE2 [Candidatus Cloacimonetes bacterium]|nr:GTP cyclohydrolase I FolE2 [Candidatus Cloacimonadota bacterium]MBS3767088.1 GTP cyclohydrolase I FolE2 [Candidatus Cloacimonadota bacterium]